jgi:hypothetical protein
VFGCIARRLNDNKAPKPIAVDSDIRYSWSGKNEDAKLFLDAGGSSVYALRYIIENLKSIITSHSSCKSLEEGLHFLSRCINDNNFEMVLERLIENE